MSKIPRRKFIQLSALAVAGALAVPGRRVFAEDLPKLSEDDPAAKNFKYVHDASTVDAASRTRPEAEQNCANCIYIQGNDGDEWRPCPLFGAKVVNANGWCTAWGPKA